MNTNTNTSPQKLSRTANAVSTAPTATLGSLPESTHSDEHTELIPSDLPETEITVYRDASTVIRVRPLSTGHDKVCLIMYLRVTEEIDLPTPSRGSHWEEAAVTDEPSTVECLPESLCGQYRQLVEKITNRFGLTKAKPNAGYGVCHRRHTAVDTHDIVSFKTCFK